MEKVSLAFFLNSLEILSIRREANPDPVPGLVTLGYFEWLVRWSW